MEAVDAVETGDTEPEEAEDGWFVEDRSGGRSFPPLLLRASWRKGRGELVSEKSLKRRTSGRKSRFVEDGSWSRRGGDSRT